jgi:hypothetical protein
MGDGEQARARRPTREHCSRCGLALSGLSQLEHMRACISATRIDALPEVTRGMRAALKASRLVKLSNPDPEQSRAWELWRIELERLATELDTWRQGSGYSGLGPMGTPMSPLHSSHGCGFCA